jgi:hypothetical protein
MGKDLKIGIFAATILLLMQGCAPSLPPCSPGSQRAGHLCYRGHDFGRVADPDFRRGVRDGCDTGSGTFRKNYRLSATSPSYREGWMKGRTLCRPADWSDDPTYSYHPAPRQRSEAPSASTPERPLYDEYLDEPEPDVRRRIPDDPEEIGYPD